MSEIMRIEE